MAIGERIRFFRNLKGMTQNRVITMTKKEKYALEWNNSAQYFYDQNSYKHLAGHISKFNTVLEVGCGTGQSTLALLEAGHSVIAVDQNYYCIEKAKLLIKSSGYSIKESIDELKPKTVYFIECDVTEPDFFQNILPDLSFDIVICWNVGSYWDKPKLENSIPKMLQYGLNIDQIKQNIESSYVELIIWCSCHTAKLKRCAVHIVDRGIQPITSLNDPYYTTLKKEFNFKNIIYDNIKATTLSKGGRQLVTNGQLNEQKVLPIIFVSVLMT